MNKRYIITIKLSGDRANYYYAKGIHKPGMTQDLFLAEIFNTLSGAKYTLNVLNTDHSTLFGSEATYTIKEVKMLTV